MHIMGYLLKIMEQKCIKCLNLLRYDEWFLCRWRVDTSMRLSYYDYTCIVAGTRCQINRLKMSLGWYCLFVWMLLWLFILSYRNNFWYEMQVADNNFDNTHRFEYNLEQPLFLWHHNYGTAPWRMCFCRAECVNEMIPVILGASVSEEFLLVIMGQKRTKCTISLQNNGWFLSWWWVDFNASKWKQRHGRKL